MYCPETFASRRLPDDVTITLSHNNRKLKAYKQHDKNTYKIAIVFSACQSYFEAKHYVAMNNSYWTAAATFAGVATLGLVVEYFVNNNKR